MALTRRIKYPTIGFKGTRAADKEAAYEAGRMRQAELFSHYPKGPISHLAGFMPPSLLKWIGNKQQVASQIISYFPAEYNTYYEPFLGGGAVLGALAPSHAVASDILGPLVQIWETLAADPDTLLTWYRERWEDFQKDRKSAYEKLKARFNRTPNAGDLLFLSRSCYGGVIRFRKDGYMSTPIGAHNPISPQAMAKRIEAWHQRVSHARFLCCDFEETMDRARGGDLVYCDPPYADSQSILYGAQKFSLDRLFAMITRAKDRRTFVALSIDGNKKSGRKNCEINIPGGIFKRVVFISRGRSMLRRFQMAGKTLESEVVADRLLLTW